MRGAGFLHVGAYLYIYVFCFYAHMCLFAALFSTFFAALRILARLVNVSIWVNWLRLGAHIEEARSTIIFCHQYVAFQFSTLCVHKEDIYRTYLLCGAQTQVCSHIGVCVWVFFLSLFANSLSVRKQIPK